MLWHRLVVSPCPARSRTSHPSPSTYPHAVVRFEMLCLASIFKEIPSFFVINWFSSSDFILKSCSICCKCSMGYYKSEPGHPCPALAQAQPRAQPTSRARGGEPRVCKNTTARPSKSHRVDKQRHRSPGNLFFAAPPHSGDISNDRPVLHHRNAFGGTRVRLSRNLLKSDRIGLMSQGNR
ncbi:hypothetical protein DFR33_11627 [Bradymonas sediminis]|nr:hypothetical protein DFR33_11627 [Bradymonas sediminis]